MVIRDQSKVNEAILTYLNAILPSNPISDFESEMENTLGPHNLLLLPRCFCTSSALSDPQWFWYPSFEPAHPPSCTSNPATSFPYAGSGSTDASTAPIGVL